MIVGVDCDGVLTDMSEFCLNAGKKYLRRDPVAPDAYNIEDMFGQTKFEKLFYGSRIFIDYCKSCPLRKDAGKVIDQLNKDGHLLYEITARKFVTLNNPIGHYSKSMLLKWFEKNKLYFEDIILCSEDDAPIEKLEECKKVKATIMIEDKPEVAAYLSKNGIEVLLFDAPYNKYVKGPNIIRIHNWSEVYEFITRSMYG